MHGIKARRLYYFLELLPFFRSNKLLSILIIVFKALSTAVIILTPFVYKYFINSVIMTGELQKLLYVVLGYIFFFGLQTVSVAFSRYFENKFMNLLRTDIKKKLLLIYTGMDFKDYERCNVGDIRLRIEVDSNALASFYINHCVNFVFSIAGSVIMLLIIFLMNWYLTLFGILMIIISFFITKGLGNKIKIVSDQYRCNQGEFESTIHKALQNWKEVKTSNLEDNEEALLSEKWLILSKLLVKRTFYQYFQGALVAFNLCFITRMNLYFFGGILVMHNLMNVATMLVFMNYYEQIYSNVQAIMDSIISLSADMPQLEGIFYALRYKNLPKLSDMKPGRLHGDLHIDNVSFRYQPSYEYVLKNITARIPLDQKTAIVGQSGCGKTTLEKLLLGVYEPDEGVIYMGETNINTISQATRNRVINAVMQDPKLFNMSILDNLLMAKRNASMKEVEHACKMANIYDFIQSTPEKYETIIGERGVKLSGGQRQRLAIARTLLLDPEIIIFDEATSSLDSESENLIVRAIQELSKQKTIISISHRFSTITGSDNIIVLQDGHIATQGSIKELMKQSGLLASIFHNQKEIEQLK